VKIRYEQVVIEDIQPSIDGGRLPVKGIVGNLIAVEATVFRHGHERVCAALRWAAPGSATHDQIPMTLVNPGLDRWRSHLRLDHAGRYRFTIVAWTDVFASWVDEFRKRVLAAQPDVLSEIAEGLSIVKRALDAVSNTTRPQLAVLLERLQSLSSEPTALLELASSEPALEMLRGIALAGDETAHEPELVVIADRLRARYGAWYELFVRSQSPVPGRPGTFADAEARLPDLHRMGFDVVYLAPIHPIGRTGRKGPNNRLDASPNDPGSPWAIGSEHGSHMAVEPSLGTLGDFDRFVAVAHSMGMDIALDLAIQCSPDHPWVREHPDWFYRRPDGTIRYAENPPKKYQDIYPLNFDTPDWKNLWQALRDVVLFWVARGVQIFRVDNPHTKPLGFWTWLIETVQLEHPDVIFLAEAFTRPPMMQALAKRGFTQSYTYFTWRNTKLELETYLTELTATDTSLYFRPNFFVNTPDILPPILQLGGRPAFKSRLLLAATLSPTYGIYSGFELCENAAISGREEYLDSEKYEIKVRDWNNPGHIKDFVTCVNRARHEQPALQQFTNLRFLQISNDQLIAYVKWTDDGTNRVIVVVNVDPHGAHEATIYVPPEAVAMPGGARYWVRDLLTGARYEWGEHNYVRLDALSGEPGHILRVEHY